MAYQLSKMSGAGNSFLILDLTRKPNLASSHRNRASLARQLCNVHWGIGADGFIFLQSDKTADVRWDFYNADGSKAEMCGNAARCVGHYLFLNSRRRQKSFSLQTAVGKVETLVVKADAKSKSAQIQVTMPPLKTLQWAEKSSQAKMNYDFVDSGVPHVVVPHSGLKQLVQKSRKDILSAASSITSANLNKLSGLLRQERRFKKRGTNVTFFEQTGARQISALTFERGVPGFTLACGTGAVAAAASVLRGGDGRVHVAVPGGDLTVEITKHRPTLTGPSIFISDNTV